jgi:hypothetical protein
MIWQLMASLRKKKPYELQLKRVKRWKKRIDAVISDYKQGTLSVDPDELADMIYCFFTCCHHVEDYIKNDDKIETEQSPREYINENEFLKISYDICIGTKHLRVDHPKTLGGPFVINFKGERNQESEKMLFNINIKSKTVYENFSKVADECISAWEYYIKKEITSKPKKQIKIKCPNCKQSFQVDDALIICDFPNCN